MAGVRRGHWTEQEDALLRHCIETTHGEGKWHQVPLKAGLNRCRKSCRLRWMNYLKPNIKRGEFSMDEDDLIIRLHKLLGNRWSLIAGRVPGRTANDVKNHWNTHLRKKTMLVTSHHPTNAAAVYQTNVIYKPRPLTFSKSLGQPSYAGYMNNNVLISNAERNNTEEEDVEQISEWWKNLLNEADEFSQQEKTADLGSCSSMEKESYEERVSEGLSTENSFDHIEHYWDFLNDE
ncbi:unnamed protein product [Rhodiola kirilowii]